jgi:transcriptional regulator with XRE-family HTH domain
MITIRQIDAGLALLGLNRSDLAVALGLNKSTLNAYFTGQSSIPSGRLGEIQKWLENSGIVFTDKGGVNPNTSDVIIYEGKQGFETFMEDVYQTAKQFGGEICLHNARPDNWLKWLGAEWNEMHTNRMLEIKQKIDFKITAGHNNYNLIGKHAEYRWLPDDMWNEQSFYSYGDRIALLHFEEDSLKIVVFRNIQFAQGFRSLFNVTWDRIAMKIPPKEKS